MNFKKNLEELGKQPDFLIIITDQQRATQHFPPGWEEQYMPNLTFFKKNGFSFDRAFCNTCMCSPSRATLLTGTYPAQHGVSQTLTELGIYSPGEIQLDNALPNIMNMLQGEGYDVQYRGKWHLSKGTTTYNTLMSADIALYGGMGWVAPDAGEDTDPLNFGGGFANHDAKFIDQGIKYLQQVKARRAAGDAKPFCLIVSLVNPHDLLAYPQSAGTYGYNSSNWLIREVGLPNTVDEPLLENKKPIAQFQTLLKLNGGLGPLPNDEDKLNYINFYAYLLSKADNEISQLTKELYASDANGIKLADKTIVIQTADHGEMGLAHGGLRQKMFVAYEEAIRVPLVISNPVLFAGDKLQSSLALASLVDVLPTIADIANVANPPSGLRGVSLLPVITDGTPVQDSILFAFDDTKAGLNNKPSFVNAANRIRCIRTEKWKYDYYFDAMGSYAMQYELYDLVNDPDEVNNLAYDPTYQSIREELEKQLKHLETTKLMVHT
ncbi:MAG: sulfatase-like hydrolase/transferase [Bacteroidota bacterium]